MSEIKKYRIADLEDLLNERSFWQLDPLPITRQRVVSQIYNPRAAKEDLALLVAFENDRVIGYTGVLPDLVFINDEQHKVGFGSTLWVSPEKRGMGLGNTLIREAIAAFDGKYFAIEFSINSKRILDRVGQFTSNDGVFWLRFGLDLKFMGSVNRRLLHIPPLRHFLGTLDWLTRQINLKLLLRQRFKSLADLTIEYIPTIDPETEEFISKHNRRELIRRGAEELEWITSYPWVLQAPLTDRHCSRYRFSCCCREFYYLKMKLLDKNNKMIAFLVLRLRDGHLTMPYGYFSSEDSTSVFRVIIDYMCALGARSFETSHELLKVHFEQHRYPILSIAHRRRYIYSASCIGDPHRQKHHFQDGDGDKAFT